MIWQEYSDTSEVKALNYALIVFSHFTNERANDEMDVALRFYEVETHHRNRFAWLNVLIAALHYLANECHLQTRGPSNHNHKETLEHGMWNDLKSQSLGWKQIYGYVWPSPCLAIPWFLYHTSPFYSSTNLSKKDKSNRVRECLSNANAG